jgi:hypothetical protein
VAREIGPALGIDGELQPRPGRLDTFIRIRMRQYRKQTQHLPVTIRWRNFF